MSSLRGFLRLFSVASECQADLRSAAARLTFRVRPSAVARRSSSGNVGTGPPGLQSGVAGLGHSGPLGELALRSPAPPAAPDGLASLNRDLACSYAAAAFRAPGAGGPGPARLVR